MLVALRRLKQVWGDTRSAHDLVFPSAQHPNRQHEFVIFGKLGMLAVGADIRRHEPMLVAHLALQTREVVVESLFRQSFHLAGTLGQIRKLMTLNKLHDKDNGGAGERQGGRQSLMPVKRSKLQLLGCACMHIAAKYEEVTPDTVRFAVISRLLRHQITAQTRFSGV